MPMAKRYTERIKNTMSQATIIKDIMEMAIMTRATMAMENNFQWMRLND